MSAQPAGVAEQTRLELNDEKCPACGKHKGKGDVFCTRDMNKLPIGLRAELKVASFKTGFLGLYAKAKELLAGGAA